MLVLMLMSMLLSHASVDIFVLSFVLHCAYAYVASEDQALKPGFHWRHKHKHKVKQKTIQRSPLKRDISISIRLREFGMLQ